LKPLEAKAHEDIARWVQDGGKLVYCGRDNDAYQNVLEWWNQGDNHYTAPSQHLFGLLGMPEQAKEGVYPCGNGQVYVIRKDPKEFVLNANGDTSLMTTIRQAYGKLEEKNSFYLERGPYVMASVVDENIVSDQPLTLKGLYIDLFDPSLPVLKKKTVQPGEQAFLYDIGKVKDKQTPQVLAAASRQYEEKVTAHSYSFVAKSPANTDNVMRIMLPKKPKTINVGTIPYNSFKAEWNQLSKTLRLQFENNPDGISVELVW
jgi:hypothetical protein